MTEDNKKEQSCKDRSIVNGEQLVKSARSYLAEVVDDPDYGAEIISQIASAYQLIDKAVNSATYVKKRKGKSIAQIINGDFNF